MDEPSETESERRVRLALAGLGVGGRPRRFDTVVPTAAVAAEVIGCPLGAIANSLIFTADGEPVLLLVSGAHRVDTRFLATELGVRRLRGASPELVETVTGQQVGGVAPVGYRRRLPAVVDLALAGYPEIWAGAGSERTMFATTAEELVRITGGRLLRVTRNG